MTEIRFNLNNFFEKDLLNILPKSNDFVFTAKKVFIRKYRIICSCGQKMVYNGYNYVRKKGFGKIRVGKQLCKCCGTQHQEDKLYWKELLNQWFDSIKSLIMVLRDSDVAWKAISKIMSYILPMSKDTAHSLFCDIIDKYEYSQKNYAIVNYDEQHPKAGRAQKYRLTLLDYKTKKVISENLADDKESETISEFLKSNLDTTKKLVVIVDCDRRYPKIFKDLWGANLVIQKCLLHLNKLVISDFGKNTSLQDEYNKYSILNIFYNREVELKYIQRILNKKSKSKLTGKELQMWIKNQKSKFYDFLKNRENKRRKCKHNLTQRKLFKAKAIFEKLYSEKSLFPKAAQKRLDMIKDNWNYFTAFYKIRDCPATNNAVENYYSTSLKQQRKKQLRTQKGIIRHMKLSAKKRDEGLEVSKKPLLLLHKLISCLCV